MANRMQSAGPLTFVKKKKKLHFISLQKYLWQKFYLVNTHSQTS